MILVTGATGNIGSHLVAMLLATGQRVRVLTRDPARIATPGVEIAVGDLAHPATLAPALAGVDRAFFVTQVGQGIEPIAGGFAEAARAAGVRHVVAVSSGAIEMVPQPLRGRWHADLEVALTGFATTFLRPDNFMSNTRRWAPVIRERSTAPVPYPDGKSVPIDPYDIAAVACTALVEERDGVLTLSGPQVMSPREQVAAIAAELGRRIEVVDLTPDQARAGYMRAGMSEQLANEILELMNRPPRPTTTVRDVTGREPRTYATWVREHRAEFA